MRLNYAGAAPRIWAGSDRQGGRPRVFPRGRLSFAGSSNFLPFADDRDLPWRSVMRALFRPCFHPIIRRSLGVATFQKVNHLGFSFGQSGGNHAYKCFRAVVIPARTPPFASNQRMRARSLAVATAIAATGGGEGIGTDRHPVSRHLDI